MTFHNLAPQLTRQRAIIEGTTEKIVEPEQIRTYLSTLARVTHMDVLSGPFAYSAHECGYGGWVHWKTSGAHVYSYPTTPPLVTVDIYTCKLFSLEKAVQFTRTFFNTKEIVWKEINV